jgi:hypothetical protein
MEKMQNVPAPAAPDGSVVRHAVPLGGDGQPPAPNVRELATAQIGSAPAQIASSMLAAGGLASGGGHDDRETDISREMRGGDERAAATKNIKAVRAHENNVARGGGEEGDGLDDIADMVTKKAKSYRDAIWRWATIGISCAGGLASGWLGSAISNQASGFFRSSVEMVSEKALKATGVEGIPAALAGKAKRAATSAATDAGGGKSDRVMPVNERLCTVLELDRSIGLVQSKPCRKVAGEAISTNTLDKSDLVARPER